MNRGEEKADRQEPRKGSKQTGRRRRILFYGDSNTYGYDPADLYELRYPEDERWTWLLQRKLEDGWEVIQKGLNGRELPDLEHDKAYIDRMLDMLEEGDVFAVMLGTNDILCTMNPDADAPAAKMQNFLEYLTSKKDGKEILVIAPPCVGDPGSRNPLVRRYHEENRKMNAGFEELAKVYGTMYVDAGSWNVGLSADLVHFSEKGHRIFADRMAEFLADQ